MNDTNLPAASEPSDLDLVRFGVSRAIQLHSEGFRAANPHIHLDLDLVEDEDLLPPDVCLAFFCFYRERLQQIARVAQVSQVLIHYHPSLTHMILDIKDDARAAVPAKDQSALSAPLKPVEGEVIVSVQPGQDTKVSAKVPFEL